MLNNSNFPADLIIRADAGERIGTGHMMRCIALGQAWKDAGGAVVVMTACNNEKLLQRLRDECFNVVVLNDSADFLPELGKLESKTVKPWVVLDGYHFDLSCQQAVRAAGHKLLMIDDYNHQPHYECDILLNQNVGSAGLDYSINPDALQLRGTDYAMLRREFRTEDVRLRRFPDLGKNILVTLGGADPDNLTLKVIRALQMIGSAELHVKVVLGPANRYLIELERSIHEFDMEIELLSSVPDMPSLMHWADLAVSAGGSTCWEFCRLGLPFVTIVIAENQRGLSNELADREVAPCLGEAPPCELISKTVSDLLEDRGEREQLSRLARELVDGFGVDRAIYRAAQDAGLDPFAGRLSFRKVASEDSELLWRWANDPSVRSQCYCPDVIPWESHRQWFSGKVIAEDVLMLILELDGCPAGQIRYDRDGEIAHIGFSIDRKFRGLGFGSRIIKDSLDLAYATLGLLSIQAEVFADNIASNRAFIHCGFRLEKKTVINDVFSNIYIKERNEY